MLLLPSWPRTTRATLNGRRQQKNRSPETRDQAASPVASRKNAAGTEFPGCGCVCNPEVKTSFSIHPLHMWIWRGEKTTSGKNGEKMSETVLKVLLGELATIRIICNQCGAVSEMTIASLNHERQKKRQRPGMRCPGCGFWIRQADEPDHPAQTDGFDLLTEAWQAFDSRRGNFQVEFVLRQEGGK